MTRSSFMRGKTTPDSHYWTPYVTSNPVTVVVFPCAIALIYCRLMSLMSNPYIHIKKCITMKLTNRPTQKPAGFEATDCHHYLSDRVIFQYTINHLWRQLMSPGLGQQPELLARALHKDFGCWEPPVLMELTTNCPQCSLTWIKSFRSIWEACMGDNSWMVIALCH